MKMVNCEIAVSAGDSSADNKASLKLKIAGACHTIVEARELGIGETLHRDRMRALTELVSANPDGLACLKSLNGKS